MKDRKTIKLTSEVKLGIVCAPLLVLLYGLSRVSINAYRVDPLDDWAEFFAFWGGVGYGACIALTLIYTFYAAYKITCRLGIPAHWARLVAWVSTDDQ